MARGFNIGDRVICIVSHVKGTVLKFYTPTTCAEQTMILCDDGRKYHAPTTQFVKIEEDCEEKKIADALTSAAMPLLRETMQINVGGVMTTVYKDEVEKELYKSLYEPLMLHYGA